MDVGIDGRALAGGRGIGRYARGMVRALADGFPNDVLHVFVAGERPSAGLPDGVRWHVDRRPQRALFAAGALLGRPRLDALIDARLDVVWMPAPAPVAVSPGTPLVLTLHDLSWEQRPADFTGYERLWHRLARPARLARRADVVVCDSDATRQVAAARWALDGARVISPGLDPPGPAGPVELPEAFVLWVGALEPRKGPGVLRVAFDAARGDGLDAELVVVGEGRASAALAGPATRLLGRVDDAVLAACYERALMVVAPSWVEGFGFGPLEAAAHGTPSVVSDLAVFRETLGDGGARFVPAGDTVALAAAMRELAADDAARAALAARARERAEAFTWPAAAAGLRQALEDAAR